MNAKEIKTFNELKNEVIDIKESVQTIKICIMGDEKKPEDTGLVGIVSNNKRWRTNVNKSLVYLIPVSTGLALKAIWSWVIGRG